MTAPKKLTTNPSLAARLVVTKGAKWPLLVSILPRPKRQDNPRSQEPQWCQDVWQMEVQ